LLCDIMKKKNNIPLKDFINMAFKVAIIALIASGIYTFIVLPENAYYIGDYKFYFVDSNVLGKDSSGNDVIGQTASTGTVLVSKELNCAEALHVCNHELCHGYLNSSFNLPKDKEEQICDKLDDYLASEECKELMKKRGC